jgi:putative two-component system response regulator
MRLRLRGLLEAEPDVAVTDHADPAAGLLEATMRAFDLVVVDYHMPAMDGIEYPRIS